MVSSFWRRYVPLCHNFVDGGKMRKQEEANNDTEPRATHNPHPHHRLPRLRRSNRPHRIPRRQRHDTLLQPDLHQARTPRRFAPHHLPLRVALPHLPLCICRAFSDPLSHPQRTRRLDRRRREEGSAGRCDAPGGSEVQVQTARRDRAKGYRVLPRPCAQGVLGVHFEGG